MHPTLLQVPRKAIVRVTDRRFAAMARYLTHVAPSTFATPIEFRAKTHFLGLATWVKGGYKKCDVVRGEQSAGTEELFRRHCVPLQATPGTAASQHGSSPVEGAAA